MSDTHLLRDEARKCREMALCSATGMAAEILSIAEYFARKALGDVGQAAANPGGFAASSGG